MPLSSGDAAPGPPRIRLRTAYPQVFVTDLPRALDFYRAVLGFRSAYLWGTPPFYALVERDGAGLNLRHVDRMPLDPDLREREVLLSANIPVENVHALFEDVRRNRADVAQHLRRQPWGTQDFIVRDPDGNLLCFASGPG